MSGSQAQLRVVKGRAVHDLRIVDIYAPWKAEIKARNWRGVHVNGDRAEPIAIGDATDRTRNGERITVRPWRLA